MSISLQKWKPIPGIILSIDFEKAFDSLNWNLLFNTLQTVNFGNTFISFIETIYNDLQSTTTNNGYVSELFKLEREVRQSCPMSVYLFILSINIFANKLRNDKSMKGIKIKSKEVKINLLADDATCFLWDTELVKNVLKMFLFF